MSSLKKIFANFMLALLFLGILVVPISSLGMLKVKNHNVLSVQDTRIIDENPDVKTINTVEVNEKKVSPVREDSHRYDYDQNYTQDSNTKETTQSAKSYPSIYINF